MHRGRLSRAMAEKSSGSRGPLLMGTSNKRVYKFRRMHFYAERGYIRLHEETTGDYKIISCQDFLLRAANFSKMAKREQDPKERKELLDMIDSMMKCVKEARHQGDPNAPGVMRQMKHDNRYIGIINPGIPTAEIPSRK